MIRKEHKIGKRIWRVSSFIGTLDLVGGMAHILIQVVMIFYVVRSNGRAWSITIPTLQRFVWCVQSMSYSPRLQCDRICTFRTSTVERLKIIETDPERKLSVRLLASLKEDPLFPVFDKSLWTYYSYDKHGNRKEKQVSHISFTEFFHGMDVKVGKLLAHISQCEEEFGADIVYQE